jgi:hypothetical protein
VEDWNLPYVMTQCEPDQLVPLLLPCGPRQGNSGTLQGSHAV